MMHSNIRFIFVLPVILCATRVLAADSSQPVTGKDIVFAESGGGVAVEAEHFFKQSNADRRAWHITSKRVRSGIKPDADPPHVDGASGGAYVEILPDTRQTHDDKLIKGENFHPVPGKGPTLHYKVHFKNPGRYYVWARVFSTGAEDNGIHVGLDGEWPESGQRWQTVKKRNWAWDCRQRTEQKHTGVPLGLFLDIKEPGEHEILIGMREDGFELDKFILVSNRNFAPQGADPAMKLLSKRVPPAGRATQQPAKKQAMLAADKLATSRQPDGSAAIEVGGTLRRWHKVTLTLDGPFADELDNSPNPFTDRSFWVTFEHESSKSNYTVPGFFAADGNAANSSAKSGTKWRAHFAPDRPGKWSYRVSFRSGPGAAFTSTSGVPRAPFHGKTGGFNVAPADPNDPTPRARGRLAYVGKHYLQYLGDKSYFLKAGADAPETLLAYTDFDDTRTLSSKGPIKTWKPHLMDWRPGDPTWRNGKGKGLIGAVNYLAGKGANAFSFLTYNVDGDGSNVWPFTSPRDKLHYDCSKLDQWGIVFDHATDQGVYLHFKMQENEMDDSVRGSKQGKRVLVPAALDGGDLGPERKLYCRELIARFGHNLALNWNLGEENTQSTKQQLAMANYIRTTDPYDHLTVVHTYPNQQDDIYGALLGKPEMTGASLQNSDIRDSHHQVVKWVKRSASAGHPWVVAFDEAGNATYGISPDPDWPGMPRKHDGPTIHETRKFVLWGTLMAGGQGVEYYFGYKLPENDLVCENWRSRDQSWNYAGNALKFFRDEKIPVDQMSNHDDLVGNPKHDNSKYCLAKPGELYLVYLPAGGATELDLSGSQGKFSVAWFNPRTGGSLTSAADVASGGKVQLTAPDNNDWLAVVRKK